MRKATAACVFFLVLAVFTSAPSAEAFKCFTCQGYIPGEKEDPYLNNKNCPHGSFDSSKVKQENTASFDKQPSCSAFYFSSDGQSLTQRIGSSFEISRNISDAKFLRMNAKVHGYICDTNLCNDKNPNAASTRSIIVPLLPLLVAAIHFLS